MSNADIPLMILGENAQHQETLKNKGYVNFIDVPDNFDYMRFLAGFGNLVPQYDGQLIWSIKSEARFANTYHSLNNKPLFPHTECYEFAGVPPRYLALWCIKAPHGGGGETTLADGYTFFNSLSAQEQEKLATNLYTYHSTPGLQESNLGLSSQHPLYDTSIDARSPIIRYSYTCLDDDGDPFIIDIRQRFLDFFERTCEKITYKENSLVLWDNWRMLHGRTGFEDESRHLKRAWIAATS